MENSALPTPALSGIAEILEKHSLPLIGEFLKDIASVSDLKQKIKDFNIALESALTDEYAYEDPFCYMDLSDYKKAIADFEAVL